MYSLVFVSRNKTQPRTLAVLREREQAFALIREHNARARARGEKIRRLEPLEGQLGAWQHVCPKSPRQASTLILVQTPGLVQR